jgi:uncharacterized protein with GYD domain
MAYFLFQWKYKDPSIKAMTEKPQDRARELRKAVEGLGGKLHQFFFAFGEYDGIAIAEFPDNESCAACSLLLSGAGANVTLSTTVLLSADEGYRAMNKASAANTGYQAPIGYSSHG